MKIWKIILFAVCMVASANHVCASPMLDQYLDNSSTTQSLWENFVEQRPLVQTFTQGVSGYLQNIDLGIMGYEDPAFSTEDIRIIIGSFDYDEPTHADPQLSASLSKEPVPRYYYGAKLEPVAHVLHGAGQYNSQDVENYRKTLKPYNPVIFMDYCGVNNTGTWFANNLKNKLREFPKYTVVQLGLSMTQDGKPEKHYEHEVAAGKHDTNLTILLNSLKRLDVPLYIRIGYESNGSWNGYQPEEYKKAFQHVTQMIRKNGINAATVWCPHPSNLKEAMRYYPGDEWVDWWAVDIFSPNQISGSKPLIAEAHKHGKPMMIGESTPRHVGVLGGKTSWDKWFDPYFELIHTSPGIKAFFYINWNWAKYPQWKNWGDARLQQNKVVAELYRKEMSLPLYQHGSTRRAFQRSMLPTGKSKLPDN